MNCRMRHTERYTVLVLYTVYCAVDVCRTRVAYALCVVRCIKFNYIISDECE